MVARSRSNLKRKNHRRAKNRAYGELVLVDGDIGKEEPGSLIRKCMRMMTIFELRGNKCWCQVVNNRDCSQPNSCDQVARSRAAGA